MKRVESDKLSPLPMITDKQLIDFHKYYVSQHGTGIVEANDFIHEIREYFRLSNTEPTGRDIGRLEDFGLVTIIDYSTKIEIKNKNTE